LEGAYPYLWVDTKQVKRKDHGRLAFGGAGDRLCGACHRGRDVIRLDIGEGRIRRVLFAFLRSLKKPSLAGLRLAVSDNHGGLKAAIARRGLSAEPMQLIFDARLSEGFSLEYQHPEEVGELNAAKETNVRANEFQRYPQSPT
jgi:hypothetical protein